MGEKVHATPTKQFFVASLTRDIDLEDAILDLLDNCVDGVMRSLKGREEIDKDLPYAGFEARITANPERFEIHDNCGGIPRDVAINQAFMFGRTGDDLDSDIPTVGMYGIGMKRALFKIGKSSIVESTNNNQKFSIRITEQWLTEPEWDLNLEDGVYVEGEDCGTKIAVASLHEAISAKFSNEDATFLNLLHKTISENFALIIKKGFKVILNGNVVEPVKFNLLSTKDLNQNEAGITPYIYRGVFEQVEVEIAIGFYRGLAAIDEIEEEGAIERKRNNAGITIVCNDRVVLHNDKTNRTGWGTGSVPSFHNQFISIAGLVVFYSKSSSALPLTTTKRGIDMSASVYLDAIDHCRDGLKKFTDFTNKWKGREEEVAPAFRATTHVDTMNFLGEKKSSLTKIRGKDNEFKNTIQLPQPQIEKKGVKIAFVKDKEEVDRLRQHYFPDSNITASEIGSWCFNEWLKIITE